MIRRFSKRLKVFQVSSIWCLIIPLHLTFCQMWPDLISKTKQGGADVVETYVFWNGHEPVRGQV